MSRISLNKTQWSKIQPHLSGRAATGRPPADDKRTLEAILFVLTTGVDGALFPLNTAVMSRHGEDIGDGHKMEPLTVYGTCSFLSLNSKENLISKNVHWMARLYEQKGGQRVGRTRGGSSSKRHAVVDGNGLPLAVVLSDGRCHDVTRALAAVESIQIGCLCRRPRASICLCEVYGIVSRNGRRQKEGRDGLQRITETCPRIAGRWNVSLPGWTISVVWRLALSDFA